MRLATTALGDYSPAVLRSNRWPGASTIVLDAQVVNIYVGNGLKYEAKPFQLPMPPLLPEECSENMPQEEGSEEVVERPGMKEKEDEPMPDPFLVVDASADDDQGDPADG